MITAKNKNLIRCVELKNQGLSIKEISEQTELGISTVRNYLAYDREANDEDYVAPKRVSEAEAEQIVYDHTVNGLSVSELSEKYNFSVKSIKNVFTKNKIASEYSSLSQIEKENYAARFGEKTVIFKGTLIHCPDKDRYDVTEYPYFGVESPRIFGIPEWKKELQRKWFRSNGKKGVNYGYSTQEVFCNE